MPRTFYKVWSIGAPVGIGATGAMHMGMAGVAKRATATQPYVVANELICNGLARMLLLPCPPGALLESAGETYFFSLDFNLAGHSLPPVSPSRIVACDQELAWGITLFDILVMNEDRHNQNIAHDRTSNQITIFDHSHSFAGAIGDIGINVGDRGKRLSIGSHCLATALTSYAGYSSWCRKIRAIPDFVIEGLVDAGCRLGIPPLYRTLCNNTLKHRRDRINYLVESNIHLFPGLAGVTR